MQITKQDVYRIAAQKVLAILLADGRDANDTARELANILSDLTIYASDAVMFQFMRMRERPGVEEVMGLLSAMRSDLQADTKITTSHLRSVLGQ
jgi:hypothetical protein